MKRGWVVALFLIALSWSVAFGMESRFKNFDEDGDKIFESLKARMITASPNEEIPVIIIYKETTPSPGAYSARLAVFVPGKKSKIVFKTIPAVAV